AAGVGAAAVVVAFAAAVGAGGDDEATCSGLDAPLVSIWNPARSGALRGRLASAGDGPRRTADRVIAALDGHGSQWIAARTSACTAARQGIDSPELLDRRMRCLDQRLVEMAAVIAALADGDQTVLRGAGEAADGLHAVADCDDPRDTMPRPASARARAEIAAAEDGLAGAWAFHAVDQCEKAIPLADQAAAAGERTGWSPLLARALILRGDCQDRRRRYEGAMETFERAATVGAQARDDAAVVEALAHRFLVLGEHLGRPGEALEGRRFIELALERAGRPPRLRAKWLHFLAIMLLAERRLDEALAAELEAIVLWRQILPAGHIYIMDSLETEANIELFIAGGSRCRFAGVVPISGGRLIQ
ncbi:MAG TPA: hypothetical protein VEL05_05785, partial [Candidatus Acidoferrum sp.]|nr:hypothetical protein [Candidatus Acidoferrum sp.]